MYANPKVGAKVRVHYGKKKLNAKPNTCPLHGKEGVVEIVGKGKPRSHGVRIDDCLYVIPCGNLVKVRPRPRRVEIRRPSLG